MGYKYYKGKRPLGWKDRRVGECSAGGGKWKY